MQFIITDAGLARSRVIHLSGSRMLLAVATMSLLMMFMAAGLYHLSRVPINGSYLSDLLPGLMVVSFGLGAVFVGVTTAATRLQDQGLITYSRGTVAIRDREGLKRSACSCYREDVEAYKRHFG